MSAWQNIILGYDDSRFSQAALAETLCWAKAHGSKVTLVNAVFFDSEEFSISPGQIDKRHEQGRAACRHAEQTAAAQGVEIECLVTQGEAHEVITELAAARGADLIVMGTHGRKGLSRMIMGSVTARVILNSPCDVLVVKQPGAACPGHYRRILVAYDGSEWSRKAAALAGEVTGEPEGAAATVLYVTPEYREMPEIIKTKSIREAIGEEAGKIVQSGAAVIAAQGLEAGSLIREGNAAKEIVKAAQEQASDLIMIGSHGWHGLNKTILGSTAERVITASPVPVLVVRHP